MTASSPLADIEQGIREIAALPPAQALLELTTVANRAVIELHKLARAQATQRRGQEDWGKWAKLANAVRNGVLAVAAVRDAAKPLGLAALSMTDKPDPGADEVTPTEVPGP